MKITQPILNQCTIALQPYYTTPLLLFSLVLGSCVDQKEIVGSKNAAHLVQAATEAPPTEQEAGALYTHPDPLTLTLSNLANWKIELSNRVFEAQQRQIISNTELELIKSILSCLLQISDAFLTQIEKENIPILSEWLAKGRNVKCCLARLQVEVEQIINKENRLYSEAIQKLTYIDALLTEQIGIEQMKRAGLQDSNSYLVRLRRWVLEFWIRDQYETLSKNSNNYADLLYSMRNVRRELAKTEHACCDLIGKPYVMYMLCKLLYRPSLHDNPIYAKYIEHHNLFLQHEGLEKVQICNLSNRCNHCKQAVQKIKIYTGNLKDVVGKYYERLLRLCNQLVNKQTIDNVTVEHYLQKYDKEYSEQIQPLINQVEHCLCQWPKNSVLDFPYFIQPKVSSTLSSSGSSHIHMFHSQISSSGTESEENLATDVPHTPSHNTQKDQVHACYRPLITGKDLV